MTEAKKTAQKKQEIDRTEIVAKVCARISAGESLRKACEAVGAVRPTVLLWIDESSEFADQYARAMVSRADAQFEELDEVSEQALTAESAVEIQGLRLKADNIKWQIARMNARKYGDKMTVAGDPEAPLSQGATPEVIAALAELSPEQLRALASKPIRGE